MGTAAVIFFYSIPCLFYSKICDNKNYEWIAISGSSFVCVAALLNVMNLWFFIEGEFYYRL